MTTDNAATVAALHSAGDDIQALADAIIKAAFLDGVPGEDRQKLRGECKVAVGCCCCCSASAGACSCGPTSVDAEEALVLTQCVATSCTCTYGLRAMQVASSCVIRPILHTSLTGVGP